MTPSMSPRMGAIDEGIKFWLPRDRTMVTRIVDVYFSRLNPNRPVFSRAEFDKGLTAIYDSCNVPDDRMFLRRIITVTLMMSS